MPTYTLVPDIHPTLDPAAADKAALGTLVKMSARKRLLVRLFDSLAQPLVRAWDRIFPVDPKPANGEIDRILVMEYWNLGDIVMLTPFLTSLRIQFPKAHITLLTSPKAAPLLDHQGLVDQVRVVLTPWAQHYSRWKKYNPFSLLWMDLFRALRSLHRQKIDLAFVGRADVRDNFMLWFIRAKQRVGYAFGGGGYFLTDAVVPDLQRPHFSNRWLTLLNAVGKTPVIREPRLKLAAQEQELAERVLVENGLQNTEFLVGIHPGARNILRKWGEGNFAALARRLQKEFPVKFIWFLDPGEKVADRNGIPAAYLALPMRLFMAVLARCDMLICNDSGPMHIAAALQVPVVAIFGPTEPAWFGPVGQQHRVVIQDGFWCRPCFDYCHFDQPYCMRTITVESVFQAAAESLSALAAKSRGRRNIIEPPASKAAMSD
jgi:lipopolysaccharide heptosyltransferase II